MKQCKIFIALLLCFITLLGFSSCVDDSISLLLGIEKTEGGSLYMKSDWDADISEPDFMDFSVYRVHFESLNEQQQRVYKYIYNNIFSHPGKIFIKNITADEMLKVYEALKFDNSHLLCLADTFRYYEIGETLCVIPQYTHSVEECSQLTEGLMYKAKEITSLIEEETDDFIKEIFVNDTVCRLTVYENSENSETAAGVFFDQKSVCSGYSLACKLLFDILGIDSFTVSGTIIEGGTETGHMWLVVKIYGEWYHFDPTWNDMETDSNTDTYGYRYFNLTTDEISQNHFKFELPDGIVCNSLAYEYYIRNGLFCTDENWRDIIEHTVQSVVFELPACAAFEFENKELLDTVCDKMFVSSSFLVNVLNSVSKYTQKNANEYNLSYSVDEDRNILEIYFE